MKQNFLLIVASLLGMFMAILVRDPLFMAFFVTIYVVEHLLPE